MTAASTNAAPGGTGVTPGGTGVTPGGTGATPDGTGVTPGRHGCDPGRAERGQGAAAACRRRLAAPEAPCAGLEGQLGTRADGLPAGPRRARASVKAWLTLPHRAGCSWLSQLQGCWPVLAVSSGDMPGPCRPSQTLRPNANP